jgi:hypothetical protein
MPVVSFTAKNETTHLEALFALPECIYFNGVNEIEQIFSSLEILQ